MPPGRGLEPLPVGHGTRLGSPASTALGWPSSAAPGGRRRPTRGRQEHAGNARTRRRLTPGDLRNHRRRQHRQPGRPRRHRARARRRHRQLMGRRRSTPSSRRLGPRARLTAHGAAATADVAVVTVPLKAITDLGRAAPLGKVRARHQQLLLRARRAHRGPGPRRRPPRASCRSACPPRRSSRRSTTSGPRTSRPTATRRERRAPRARGVERPHPRPSSTSRGTPVRRLHGLRHGRRVAAERVVAWSATAPPTSSRRSRAQARREPRAGTPDDLTPRRTRCGVALGPRRRCAAVFRPVPASSGDVGGGR